ncbi:MAG: hypothetical protein H6739_32215 [Alphaproteobacteria bacterium]|nr:hypothetical protein [Alphaproteobacteria bacterium]
MGALTVLLLMSGLAFGADAGFTLGQGLKVEGASGASLTASMFMQERLLVDPVASTEVLQVPVLRPNLRVAAGELPLSARVQVELAGASASLLDAHVDLKGPAGLGLRAGRFLVPSCRQQLTPVSRLILQDFAPSANAFRAGRDLGVQGSWQPEGGHADVRLGVFDGPTLDDGGNDPTAIGRAAVGFGAPIPLDEGLGLRAEGVGVSFGVSGQARARSQAVVGAAELALRASVTQLVVEGFASRSGDLGGYAQLGIGVWPEHLLVVGRVDRLQQEGEGTTSTEEGLVWMIRPEHVVRIGVAHQATLPDDGAAHHQGVLSAQVRI